MDLLFLGTGAAEAIPAMFCRCDYCARARKSGGRDLRTRSSFRIDAKHQIDMSPDCYKQAMDNRLDFFDLEHLLITHSHDDHFDFMQLLSRECAVPTSDRPLYVYMQREGASWAIDLFSRHMDPKDMAACLKKYRIVPLDYFQEFRAGELDALAIKANHAGYGAGEFGLNFLIRLPDGRKLLYATDTGWYQDETWDCLRGKKADIVILEATFGDRLDRGEHPEGHLDVRSASETLATMSDIGFIEPETRVYITHINHKHSMLHDDMQLAFDSSRVRATVAYDGLRIDGEANTPPRLSRFA